MPYMSKEILFRIAERIDIVESSLESVHRYNGDTEAFCVGMAAITDLQVIIGNNLAVSRKKKT